MGKGLRFRIDGELIGGSRGCTVAQTTHTADATTKDCAAPDHSHPEAMYTEWQGAEEFAVTDIGTMVRLVGMMRSRKVVSVAVEDDGGSKLMSSDAVVTGIRIACNADGLTMMTVNIAGRGKIAHGEDVEEDYGLAFSFPFVLGGGE